jgi:hypothetical protein
VIRYRSNNGYIEIISVGETRYGWKKALSLVVIVAAQVILLSWWRKVAAR